MLFSAKGASLISTTLESHWPSVTVHQVMSARTRLPDISDGAERLQRRARTEAEE